MSDLKSQQPNHNNDLVLYLSLALAVPLVLVASLLPVLARGQSGSAGSPADWHSADLENITYTTFLPLVSHVSLLIPPDDLAIEATIADSINQHRADHGLSSLALVSELTQSARRHSNDMAENGFTGHTGSDGSNAGQRMTEAGYDWIAWGEIIGWGFGGDPVSMVDWWMNSPPHRSLILSTYLVDVGVGYTRDPGSQWGHYWTVNFGRPATSFYLQREEVVQCVFLSNGPAGGSSHALYNVDHCYDG